MKSFYLSSLLLSLTAALPQINNPFTVFNALNIPPNLKETYEALLKACTVKSTEAGSEDVVSFPLLYSTSQSS
jgi:hypothetical protein